MRSSPPRHWDSRRVGYIKVWLSDPHGAECKMNISTWISTSFPCFFHCQICVRALPKAPENGGLFNQPKKATNHRISNPSILRVQTCHVGCREGDLGGSPPFIQATNIGPFKEVEQPQEWGTVLQSVGWCSCTGDFNYSNLNWWSSPISGCHQRRIMGESKGIPPQNASHPPGIRPGLKGPP